MVGDRERGSEERQGGGLELPPRPQNPTPLQAAYHDYIRGLCTYSHYKKVVDKAIAEEKGGH